MTGHRSKESPDPSSRDLAACGGDDSAAPSAASVDTGFTAAQPPSSGSESIVPPTAGATTSAPLATDAPTTAPPETAPEVTAADVLERNPLYSVAAMQSAGCSSASTSPLDNLDNVRVYYSSVLTCLDAAWAQIGNGTGIAARPAGLEVFTGPSSAPCLNGVEYSFYCTANETIYMYADEMIRPWLEFPQEYGRGLTRLSATHTIAHEYGHHVQQYTGIFGALSPDFSGTEMERHLELQASCLANIFLAA